MSANNWAVCPQCMKNAEETQAENKVAVEASYGVIPSEEYAARREEAHEPIALDCTMREDYEIAMNLLGEFNISYSASCSNCGFRFVHRTNRQVDLE
ncbi:hypothetical protein LCGC14_0975660 [marine sediment metagenome]|uniref:Uncharacterized protein n=1 Tax=marine sediment metagenome TaxID=412755 RepID=A0A0F9NWJ3_9ZZZZ